MADVNCIVGLSIERSTVRAVEIERTADGVTLLAADTWTNTLPAPGETMSEGNVGAFKDALDAFLKVNRVKARHASVALDTSDLFITTIPLPDTATRDNVLNQLAWEIQQFYPDVAPSDFVHDAHRLAVDREQGSADFLCVAVRRQYVRTLQLILSHRGLRPEFIDADHFGAEHALRAAYPETIRTTILFAGVKTGRVDLSVFRNGRVAAYDFAPIETPDALPGELKRRLELGQDIASIMAYGPALDDAVLADLRTSLPVPLETVDPFRSLRVSSAARLSEGLKLSPHWFCAAVGAALRNE